MNGYKLVISPKKIIRKIIKRIQPSESLGNNAGIHDFDFDTYIKKLKKYLDTININEKDFIANPYRPLVISCDKKIRSLRLDLHTAGLINLHSIEFVMKSGERIKPDELTIHTSSSHALSKKYLEEKIFMDADNSLAWTIHTKQQNKPWVQFTFTDPVNINRILIHNRKDSHSIRSGGLKVYISSNLRKWKLVYSVGVKKIIDRSFMESGIFKYKHGAEIHNFVCAVIMNNDNYARNQFNSIPTDLKDYIRTKINDHYLAHIEKEWISHGIQRSFRFWSLAEKKKYLKVSQKLVNDLRSLSEDVCFGFGSVLAIYRDHDLIPHDDDTDIIIALDGEKIKSITDGRMLVKRHLEPLGYIVSESSPVHWHVTRDNLTIDVFVGLYEKDGTIGWMPGPRGILTRDILFPSINKEMLGVSCSIPKESDKYLEITYGKDWKYPDPNHKHKWVRNNYEDLL